MLANRLTEDAGATVLLLEAGGSDSHPYIQVPLGYAQTSGNTNAPSIMIGEKAADMVLNTAA